MNTYKKYCPNVFVAACEEKHTKGDKVVLTTKYGKENECIIHNYLGDCKVNGDIRHMYSITRVDAFDYKAWALRKAEAYQNRAISAKKKSDHYYNRSNKDKDFLSLAEPIKIGHHSEKRHRKIIREAQENTSKFVAFYDKAGELQNRVSYWEERSEEINLSMPESLEYYQIMLHKATKRHEGLKNGSIPRTHSYSLTYAKKDVNKFKKLLNTAIDLWE